MALVSKMWLAVFALPMMALAAAPRSLGAPPKPGKGPIPRGPAAPGNPLTTGMPLHQQSISIPDNTIWLRPHALNPNQWSYLDHKGKLMAYQYFLKMHNTSMLTHDVERYLEILAYVHEYLEWGAQGPPGGFSIQNIPKAKPTNKKKKRAVEEDKKGSEEELEQLLEKSGVAQLLPKDKRSAVLSVVSKTLTELRPLLPHVSLDDMAIDIKKMDENRGKRHVSEQPRFVTLFTSKAEKKYNKFLKREKKAAGERKPYVEAIGTYVIVPKDTDLDWLQTEYRKTMREQRHRRDIMVKLKKAADSVKVSL